MPFSREYRISHEAAVKKVRSQSTAWLPVVVTLFFGGLFLANFLNGGQLVRTPILLLAGVAITLIGLYVGWRKGQKRAIARLTSQVFILTEDGLEYHSQKGDTKMKWDTIRSATETRNGMEVSGPNGQILVPKYLEGYQEIRHVISGKTQPVS